MGSIESFNQILNQSTSHRNQEWLEYRNTLTETVLDMMNSNPSKESRILVCAAGNSDDLDLKKIYQKSSELSLVDIDLKAMEKALGTYGISNVKTQVFSEGFTGLENNQAYDDLIISIIKSDNDYQIKLMIKKLFEDIRSHTFLAHLKGYFDTIIVSPVYTQLIIPQMFANMQILKDINFENDRIEMIKDLFMQEMPKVISRFNGNLLNLIKDNGNLIVVSDIFEFQTSSSLYAQLKTVDDLDDYHKKYIDTYGLGLGDYGLEDMNSKAKRISSKWLEWPFTKNMAIFVKVELFVKNAN